MSMSSQDLTLSFDDILAAVKETARGRWFVESLEVRTRSGNTTRILESISRLEDRIEQFAHANEDTTLVKKAREAIAAARSDIARLENKPAHLSHEAQLFARLATQAKDAFAHSGTDSKSVNRALVLVDDLDRELNPRGQPAAAASQPSQLFQQDEAIFEAAPSIQSAAPAAEQPKEMSGRGAKVVIQKIGAPVLAVPAAEPASEAPTTLLEPQVPEAEPTHNRIVVVRREPGEAANVPLLEDADTGAASAA